MAGEEWRVTEQDSASGEWFRWNRELAERRPELAAAVQAFEADVGSNRKAAAAASASRWFKEDAMGEEACVTRMLVAKGHVVVFYALASGEMLVTSSRKLNRMGIRGGHRVGSSHIEWIARDRRAHSGAGWLGVKHATDVALRASVLQGNRALTLDSYDRQTEEMWKAKGFHASQSEGADGLRRLYIPLFGVDYGSLKRAAAEAADC